MREEDEDRIRSLDSPAFEVEVRDFGDFTPREKTGVLSRRGGGYSYSEREPELALEEDEAEYYNRLQEIEEREETAREEDQDEEIEDEAEVIVSGDSAAWVNNDEQDPGDGWVVEDHDEEDRLRRSERTSWDEPEPPLFPQSQEASSSHHDADNLVDFVSPVEFERTSWFSWFWPKPREQSNPEFTALLDAEERGEDDEKGSPKKRTPWSWRVRLPFVNVRRAFSNDSPDEEMGFGFDASAKPKISILRVTRTTSAGSSQEGDIEMGELSATDDETPRSRRNSMALRVTFHNELEQVRLIPGREKSWDEWLCRRNIRVILALVLTVYVVFVGYHVLKST